MRLKARVRADDTRERILGVAIEQFAAHGIEGVSVRDITQAAGANAAAISYHFGSKEDLVAEAFRAVVVPLHEERLRELRAHLAKHPGTSELTAIIRAFISPVVRAARGQVRSDAATYHRFHILAFALRKPFVDKLMSDLSDAVASAFVDALSVALPGVPRSAVWWRFDFMVGSLVHILLDADRSQKLKRLSGGSCDTADADAIIAQLTAFIAAGFRAPTLAD